MASVCKKSNRQHFWKKRGRRRLSSLVLSASMTVEAAMVLPLFLFFCANILFIFEMMRFQTGMFSALHDTGMKMCEYAYFLDESVDTEEVTESGETEGDFDFLGALAGVAFSEGYVRNSVNPNLSAKRAVEGGSGGISYLQSEFDLERGTILLVADYRFRAFIPVIAPSSFPAQSVFYGHMWTGYENAEETEGSEEEKVTVFVTASGTKYHRDRNCTYLKITPIPISGAALDSARNESGGKYYPCEVCRPRRNLPYMYITRTGNRYHSKRTCSSLKRSVISMRLDYAKEHGYTPCSKCGGE